jgi:hypothetical protein
VLLAQILQSRRMHLEGGVVDQHIQPPLLAHSGRDGATAEGALAYIPGNHDGAPTLASTAA